VAGGSGSRMGQKTPKQFLVIGQKPILMHTIERFLEADPQIQLILVLPPKEMPAWHALCEKYDFYPAIVTTHGGASRFQSVRNGLKTIKASEGLVAVHDGVRPFVSCQIIQNSFETAANNGTAVACVALKDSIRIIENNDTNKAADRMAYKLIQTPQTFRLDFMREAFACEELPNFTDCASVLEHAGHRISLIEGAYENIKITTPEDLLWAEAYLLSKEK
jgi:2-C-methyl-D-erythritol 4-phosphate cytidylyltransferase